MTVEFDKSFAKSLDKVKYVSVAIWLVGLIEQTEKAGSINSLKGIKKMVGFRSYYRIRLGDYWVGDVHVVCQNGFCCSLICTRKNIYKRYP